MPEAIPELAARAKAHFGFSKEERRDFIIAILLVGIILGFDDGQPTFELIHWIVNLLACLLIAAFVIFINLGAQRLLALAKGYVLTHKMFVFGTLGGTIIGLASIGKLVLFAPFELVFNQHEGLRLGRFRYGLNYYEMAVTAMMGPLANLLAAIIFKFIYLAIPSFFILNIVKLNVFMAVATMLPIPKLAGSYVFMGNPFLFILVLSLSVVMGLLLFLLPPGWAIVAGGVLSLILATVYFFKLDYK